MLQAPRYQDILAKLPAISQDQIEAYLTVPQDDGRQRFRKIAANMLVCIAGATPDEADSICSLIAYKNRGISLEDRKAMKERWRFAFSGPNTKYIPVRNSSARGPRLH